MDELRDKIDGRSKIMPLWALFLATLVRYGGLENVRKSKEFIFNFLSIY